MFISLRDQSAQKIIHAYIPLQQNISLDTAFTINIGLYVMSINTSCKIQKTVVFSIYIQSVRLYIQYNFYDDLSSLNPFKLLQTGIIQYCNYISFTKYEIHIFVILLCIATYKFVVYVKETFISPRKIQNVKNYYSNIQ